MMPINLMQSVKHLDFRLGRGVVIQSQYGLISLIVWRL